MKFIHPGIVDQNIDFTRLLNRMLRQVTDSSGIAQIRLNHQMRIAAHF